MKLSLLLLSFSTLSFSQVGINTNKPKTSLDVNGDITIRGSLKVGADSKSGEPGDVLTSDYNGTLKWQKVSQASNDVFEGYILTEVLVYENRNGIKLINPNNNTSPFNNGDIDDGIEYDNRWNYLSNTDGSFYAGSFTVNKENTLIVVTLLSGVYSDFRTDNIVPIKDVANAYTDYLGALFIKNASSTENYKLLVSRRDTLDGFFVPSKKFLISYSFNVDRGTYYIFPAFARIGSDYINSISFRDRNLYIGHYYEPLYAENIFKKFTPFMNKTVMKIDIYEPKN